MLPLLFALFAYAGALERTCHQTCAELLNHDAHCEEVCGAKAKQPRFATFCPEYNACMKSCDARGDRSSVAWGNCRDVCVALSIRVDCANGVAPDGAPGGNVDSTAMAKGGQGPSGPARAAGADAPPASASTPPPAPAPSSAHDTSLLRAFEGKGQIANIKTKGALTPSNGLEGIVAAAIQSGKSDPGELTLFERVHLKYGAIETALRQR